jgi:hypothetical protein
MQSVQDMGRREPRHVQSYKSRMCYKQKTTYNIHNTSPTDKQQSRRRKRTRNCCSINCFLRPLAFSLSSMFSLAFELLITHRRSFVVLFDYLSSISVDPERGGKSFPPYCFFFGVVLIFFSSSFFPLLFAHVYDE